jgi:hypothetical protein
LDDIEREAIRAEGLDPDDPEIIAAIDRICWEFLAECVEGGCPGPVGTASSAAPRF